MRIRKSGDQIMVLAKGKLFMYEVSKLPKIRI